MRTGNLIHRALLLVAVLLSSASGRASAIEVGDLVHPVQVRDANDKAAWLPDLGRKVLVIFYTDPDEKEQNEPFREQLKAAKLDRRYFRGLGIVNLKDTWKPNFAVRAVVRKKIKKFKSVILTDPSHIVKHRWELGDCNGKDVVLIIGADKRLRYIKGNGAMNATERQNTIALVKRLIAQATRHAGG